MITELQDLARIEAIPMDDFFVELQVRDNVFESVNFESAEAAAFYFSILTELTGQRVSLWVDGKEMERREVIQ